MTLNPLAQINGVTIIGMIVIFWMTFIALKVVFYNPLLEVVVARRQKITAGAEKLAEAEQVTADARRGGEALLAEADAEVEKIAREAGEEAEAQRQEKIVAAKEEAEALLVEGRARVTQVRKAEEQKVREELVGCTTVACDKLVGGVEPRLINSIVDKVMRARLAT